MPSDNTSIDFQLYYVYEVEGYIYNYRMDIDDQLEMLQRQLMAVQEEKTNPLSERTVAEIMVKLYHEGFAFYPTTDGNQYVTPEQLDREITTLVMERGRINLGNY